MRVYSGYVLVIEDDLAMSAALQDQLDSWNYEVTAVTSGAAAMKALEQRIPDLIISDINIEGEHTGLWVCEQVRLKYRNDYIPIIVMTGSLTERVAGLRAGADDFLNKPFNAEELALRSETLLRIRSHLGRLRRFFSPQIADLIVSDGDEDAMVSHRQDVTVLFVDLRGFTAFSEKSPPDVVMGVLNEYYAEVGRLAMEHKGTLGHIAGDGMMIFFNDPIKLDHHQMHALKMIQGMRQALDGLQKNWQSRGLELSYGIGVACGVATVGAVGFREFWEYSVIGAVPNIAARLCDAAQGGQVLMCENFKCSVDDAVSSKPLKDIRLRGVGAHMSVFALE